MTLLERYEPTACSRALLLVLVGAMLGLPGCFIIKGVDVSDDPDSAAPTPDMMPGMADMESMLDMTMAVDADMASPADMAEDVDEGPSIMCPMSDDDLCEVARTSSPAFCGTIAIEDPCTESLRSIDCGCNTPAEQCIDRACVACDPPLPKDACEAASSCEDISIIDDCGRNIMIDCGSMCPPGSTCSDGACEVVTEDGCAFRGTECGSIYDDQSEFLEHCGYCDEGSTCSGNRCITSLNACVGGMACGSATQNCLCSNSTACLLSLCVEMDLSPDDRTAQMYFGASTALHDDLLVVGASNETVNGMAGAGAVYVFRRDQRTGKWVERQRLVSPIVQADAKFGSGVDTDGRFIVVGSRDFDGRVNTEITSNSGRVDIFEVRVDDQWGWVEAIEPPEIITERRFGRPVRLHDGDLYVGAPATGGGYVAVYDRAMNGDWGLIQQITSPIGNTAGRFGYSFDLRGDALLVGASANSNMPDKPGHAFAFSRAMPGEMWSNSGAVFKAFDPTDGSDDSQIGDEFGADVTIAEVEVGVSAVQVFVITAPGHNGNAGATYTIIPGSDPMEFTRGRIPEMRQGTSLTTCGDRLFVGAAGHNSAQGLVDVYDVSVNFDDQVVITHDRSISPPANGNDGQRFGTSISCWGDTAAVGAVYRAVGNLTNAGDVYFFDLEP